MLAEVFDSRPAHPSAYIRFYLAIVKYLNVELAPRMSMHGVLIEVYGEGILILGESGVGKSETALEVVKRGHRLIADDLVEVRRVSDTTLLGRAPEIIRHLIEIRGIGILDVKELYGVSSVKMQENINFVINLELWDEKKPTSASGSTKKPPLYWASMCHPSPSRSGLAATWQSSSRWQPSISVRRRWATMPPKL